MKRFLLTLMAVFAIASAYAGPCRCFYLHSIVGVNFVNKQSLRGEREEFDPGGLIGGGIGFRFFDLVRIEGEATYRTNNFYEIVAEDSNLPSVGFVHFPTTGYRRMVSAMANGIIELPFINQNVLPYVGAGVGERWSRVKGESSPVVFLAGTARLPSRNKSESSFAYQVLAGLIFTATERMQVGVEFRHFDGQDFAANHSFGLNARFYF